MMTLMSHLNQVSRSGVQADSGPVDGLNLWSWAFGLPSSVSAGSEGLVLFLPFTLTLICLHPTALSFYLPSFLFSHPLVSPSPSNKLLSNDFSLCRRWSTSVIWTVTWCVFCWGGPLGTYALLTTSSGVSSTLRLYLKTRWLYIEHTYWIIWSCWLLFSHSDLSMLNWYLILYIVNEINVYNIFMHSWCWLVKVMHM